MSFKTLLLATLALTFAPTHTSAWWWILGSCFTDCSSSSCYNRLRGFSWWRYRTEKYGSCAAVGFHPPGQRSCTRDGVTAAHMEVWVGSDETCQCLDSQLFGCEEKQDNIVDIALKTDVVSTLAALLSDDAYAGVLAKLQEDGPFTVFAPSNDAFNDFLAATGVNPFDDQAGTEALVAQVLTYHVLDGQVKAGDLGAFQTPETLEGSELIVRRSGADVSIQLPLDGVPSNVIAADVVATNGVIHVVDKVLFPFPAPILETAEAGGLSTLVAILSDVRYSDIAGILSGDGPFTVFAPTDQAFADLGVDPFDDNNVDTVKDVLKYHVLAGARVFSDNLSAKQHPETFQGSTLDVRKDANGVTVNGNNVALADQLCTNGVVHVIDGVLLPPASIVDIVVNSASDLGLTTLLTLLTSPDNEVVLNALTPDGTFTVFAPTDAAFTAFLGGLPEPPSAETVRTVLFYHVLAGAAVYAGDLDAFQTVATAAGLDAVVRKDGNGVEINGASNVETADIKASNGVIHIIDAVLVPPASILDTAGSVDALSTLAALLSSPKYEAVKMKLMEDGPFTVFAPTNDAFTTLLTEAEIADPFDDAVVPTITEILQYHVLGARVFSDQLQASQEPATLLGPTVDVQKGSGGVTVNGNNVGPADVLCSNGVVHVIDGVLLPPPAEPNIVDTVVGDHRLGTLETVLGQFPDLIDTLSGDGPFTVFAPTDRAFEKAIEKYNPDADTLKTLLTYHVVAGAAVLSNQLQDGQRIATVQGEEVEVNFPRGSVAWYFKFFFGIQLVDINDSRVVEADLESSNGVVHIIDEVLVPPSIG